MTKRTLSITGVTNGLWWEQIDPNETTQVLVPGPSQGGGFLMRTCQYEYTNILDLSIEMFGEGEPIAHGLAALMMDLLTKYPEEMRKAIQVARKLQLAVENVSNV